MNPELLFNRACHELTEETKPDRIEGLAIFKARAKQIEGWVIRGESERDIIENLKCVILSDLIDIQFQKTKTIWTDLEIGEDK